MSDKQQIFQFSDELDRIVDRFRAEYDLTYAAVVGVLHMKAHLLCVEAGNRDEDAETE